MSVLALADPKVKALIRKHPLLSASNILGRGSFCLVFKTSDPTRVLKLIADPQHVQYLLDKNLTRSVFRPKVYQNHGTVGNTLAGVPIHLIEVERLYRLRPGEENYALAMHIVRFYERSSKDFLPQTKRQFPCANLRMLEFIRKLNTYKKTKHMSFDMHAANFMQRSDGRIVFSDPFFDKKVMNSQSYSVQRRKVAA